MGTQAEVANRNETLSRTIAQWLVVEETTIRSAAQLVASTQSTLVQQVMRLIQLDSEKHREILGTIQGILSGTITMTPEELGEISALLEEHKRIEGESIILGNTALEHTEHFVIRQLLGYLLEDERKHVTMTEQVQEYKRKIYP